MFDNASHVEQSIAEMLDRCERCRHPSGGHLHPCDGFVGHSREECYDHLLESFNTIKEECARVGDLFGNAGYTRGQFLKDVKVLDRGGFRQMPPAWWGEADDAAFEQGSWSRAADLSSSFAEVCDTTSMMNTYIDAECIEGDYNPCAH